MPNISNQFSIQEDFKLFQNVDFSKGRWDESRIFKIIEHAYTGKYYEILSQKYDITLVTQSSLDKLSWLKKVSDLLKIIKHSLRYTQKIS